LKRRLKIAIYSGVIPSTTFIERLIQGLSENGLEIYLFGQRKGKITHKNNIHFITYSNKWSKASILVKYTLLLNLFKRSQKEKLDKIIHSEGKNIRLLKIKYYPVLYHHPDIFHLQWAKGVKDWMWVKEFGIKLVVSLRGAHINYSPIADLGLAEEYKKCFPFVDRFHAVSEAIKMESIKYNALSNNVEVIYSGLNLNGLPFQIKEFDKKATLKIVSIGRDHWIKGYSYALMTMNKLKKMGIPFQYTIIGVYDNEELLYLRDYLDLNNELKFSNTLPFDSVIDNIKESDVLLLPSIEEGIANVAIEAMALGTLVVSTDCGGMKELIYNNENGYLVPIRNSDEMTFALEKVSKLSKDSYLTMTKTARKTIEVNHTLESMDTKMKELYIKTVNS